MPGRRKNYWFNVTFPKAFEDLSGAREWFASFVHSYNTKHRHSGIGYVTPEQKHTGEDVLLLALRQEQSIKPPLFSPSVL